MRNSHWPQPKLLAAMQIVSIPKQTTKGQTLCKQQETNTPSLQEKSFLQHQSSQLIKLIMPNQATFLYYSKIKPHFFMIQNINN